MDGQVVVVGGGIAGLSCARELADRGIEVVVLDRGRGPGGRMSSPLWAGRPVDVGASYLTVEDDAFAEVVEDWHRRGLAREWTDTFCVLGGSSVELKQGPMRWGAAAGLRSLVADLAADLPVERHQVATLSELDGAAAIVLAMPDPQAARLLPVEHPLRESLQRTFEPVLALAARWPERTWDDVSPSGGFDGAFVNDHEVVSWVADDGRRRGDDAPVLIAHSTPDFAGRHLEDPAAASAFFEAALCQVLGVTEPTDAFVHRWRFARPTGDREERFVLSDERVPVGVCGDGWGPASKVETAWLSGRDLARALASRLRAG